MVNCARKTELTRWTYLFEHAGDPSELFDKCLEANDLRTAASYLLVLHSLESSERSADMTVRLLRRAAAAKKWSLCGDLLRFLRSVDESGKTVKDAILQAGLLKGVSADVIASPPPPFNVDDDGRFASDLPSPTITLTSTPTLPRRVSAPHKLATTLEEGDEETGDEDAAQEALDFGSPRRLQQAGQSVQLGTPSATTRRGLPRRVSVPVSQAGARSDESQTDAASRYLRPSASSPLSVSGLGMSLSRVGLRSSDRLASPQHRALGASSPGNPNSTSPSRTVEESVVE